MCVLTEEQIESIVQMYVPTINKKVAAEELTNKASDVIADAITEDLKVNLKKLSTGEDDAHLVCAFTIWDWLR